MEVKAVLGNSGSARAFFWAKKSQERKGKGKSHLGGRYKRKTFSPSGLEGAVQEDKAACRKEKGKG